MLTILVSFILSTNAAFISQLAPSQSALRNQPLSSSSVRSIAKAPLPVVQHIPPRNTRQMTMAAFNPPPSPNEPGQTETKQTRKVIATASKKQQPVVQQTPNFFERMTTFGAWFDKCIPAIHPCMNPLSCDVMYGLCLSPVGSRITNEPCTLRSDCSSEYVCFVEEGNYVGTCQELAYLKIRRQ